MIVKDFQVYFCSQECVERHNSTHFFFLNKCYDIYMLLSELSKRIKLKRESAHLTQKQLANSLQISYQAISKWERGENAPDISVLPQLASLLNVTIDWLLTGEEIGKDTFEASVLYVSLRGYAKDSIENNPKIMSKKMNHIFHQLTECVLEFKGVPVKYVGDGFLSYFNGLNHQKRVLDTAHFIKRVLDNPKLIISVNVGDIFLGTIGHKDYASLDIMGDAVNNVFLMNNWASKNDKTFAIFSKHFKPFFSDQDVYHKENMNLYNGGLNTVFSSLK